MDDQPPDRPAAPAPDRPPYPPERHLLRDLDLEVEHRHDGTSRAWMPVVPHLLDGDHGVRAGALATLVDVIGGGLAALAAHPDWIATADLTLHLVDNVTGGTVQADASVLRAGRTTVVLEVVLSDGGRRRLGTATMSFSVLPRRDTNPVIAAVDGEPVRMTMALPGSGLRAPYLDAAGVRLGEPAGVAEIVPADYVRNSLGALQGGVMATLLETAGREGLRAACGAPVVTTDLQVTYLALGRVGPIRAAAEVLAAHGTHGAARVVATDHGNGDRRTSVGRVVATLPGSVRT